MAARNMAVIIPTYRRPELLRKCLEAVANQTHPAGEVETIVVSDGPDTATSTLVKQIVARYPLMNLQYHELSVRRGPAAARNEGWLRSSAKLIVFTDDDCIPSADWLAAYWQSYSRLRLSLIAFTGAVVVPVPDMPTDYEKNVAHLQTAEFVTANCACTPAALKLVGGFDPAFPVAWREDSDLQFNLVRNRIPIMKVPEAKVEHPVRSAPWGISIADQQKSMFNALLFKKHPELYKEKIAPGPVWKYYLIIVSGLLALAALALGTIPLLIIAAACWTAGTVSFIMQRMRGTRLSFSHCAEMILTSVLIPYLSVYWTLRGAWRYKVFFL